MHDKRQRVIGYGVGLALAAGMLLAGCNGFDREQSNSPVAPGGEATMSHFNPTALGNFYATGGVETGDLKDQIATYSEKGQLVVQAPAGDYLLAYSTASGLYAVVFRAAKTALVFIGLNQGESVIHAMLFQGTITTLPAQTWQNGAVTLYAWPGSAAQPLTIFRNESLDAFVEFVLAQEPS